MPGAEHDARILCFLATPRRFYARRMRRHATTQGAAAEARDLDALLRGLGGVARVKTIEPHPKGGHRVTLDLAPSGMQAFVDALEAHG